MNLDPEFCRKSKIDHHKTREFCQGVSLQVATAVVVMTTGIAARTIYGALTMCEAPHAVCSNFMLA